MDYNYNFNENINVITTPNGDKVITANDEIFTLMLNTIYDGQLRLEQEGHKYSADAVNKLWTALYNKSENIKNEQ